MNIHFIIHEIFEAPGAILQWAKKRNYTISFTKSYLYEKLPDTISNIDILIIMGGPQSPNTTKKECSHFDAKAEITFIQNAIHNKKAVLGICLGAQLIGEALGAKVEQSPEKEIGKFPIALTEYGLTNKKFIDFGNAVEVGHWHNDMPGLTNDCKIIAYSQGCPRQIIEYNNLVYGFQCHLEFTTEVIELMITHSQKELLENVNKKYVQQSDVLRNNDYKEMNQTLFSFLDRLTIECQLHRKNGLKLSDFPSV